MSPEEDPVTPSIDSTGAATTCPFLAPVVADRLWLYPVSVYCRRTGGRPRIPAGQTLAARCLTQSYEECAGYQTSQVAAG
jgi:hypothetical protein